MHTESQWNKMVPGSACIQHCR